MLHVHIRHAALASVVRTMLEADSGEPLSTDGMVPASGDTVVATTLDVLPAECQYLTARGVHVIVLAAVVNEDLNQRYLDAGVDACLEMTADTGALLEVVSRLAAKRLVISQATGPAREDAPPPGGPRMSRPEPAA